MFFLRILQKIRDVFSPDAIVCQCGADGLSGDPMDSFNLTQVALAKPLYFLLNWKLPTLVLGGGKNCPSSRHLYRISSEFSFHTMYNETSFVFHIPSLWQGGYNTHEFHNILFGMKIHLRFFLLYELTRNELITT